MEHGSIIGHLVDEIEKLKRPTLPGKPNRRIGFQP